jgi:hypothetical protein
VRAGFLWWLLGCDRVVWFGSTGLDLQTGLAAVPAGGVVGCNNVPIDDLGAIQLTQVGSILMASVLATELKCTMKSP